MLLEVLPTATKPLLSFKLWSRGSHTTSRPKQQSHRLISSAQSDPWFLLFTGNCKNGCQVWFDFEILRLGMKNYFQLIKTRRKIDHKLKPYQHGFFVNLKNYWVCTAWLAASLENETKIKKWWSRFWWSFPQLSPSSSFWFIFADFLFFKKFKLSWV